MTRFVSGVAAFSCALLRVASHAAVIDKGDTLRVRLTDQIPVFIFYWTAFASPDGAMNFRSDPYSWDRLLLQRIGVLDAPKA